LSLSVPPYLLHTIEVTAGESPSSHRWRLARAQEEVREKHLSFWIISGEWSVQGRSELRVFCCSFSEKFARIGDRELYSIPNNHGRAYRQVHGELVLL
jgi:hypothetical protein